MLLAGDIGGTKTTLAFFSPEKGATRPLHESTFPSRDYPSLADLIAHFLKNVDLAPTGAIFGIAGPVTDGRAQTTNLPWTIDAHHLGQTLSVHVDLINDLEAIATAVPHLEAADLATLKAGTADADGSIAVIAPGTGLGQAFLVWDGQRYRAHPSEGGHTSFAPTTAQQLDMLAYLQKRFEHVSYERVCSGIGIPTLYDYLRQSGRYQEPAWLRQALAQNEDPTPIIVESAVNQTADICVAALDLFMEILGDEAGNLALKVLATGGVYIGGGIPPRILPQLRQGPFLKAFHQKGRFSDLMKQIPIHIICNPKTALQGAAYKGLEQLGHG